MGNCFSCFKVPPPPSAPHMVTDNDKEDMPELENLYNPSSTYVPTPLNNSNTIYDAQSNGNTTYHHSVAKSAGPTAVLTPSSTLIGSDNFGSVARNNERSSRTFGQRKPPSRSTSAAMGQTDSKQPSDTKLNTLFDVYKDPSEDTILADGIERLCIDLQVSPDEFKVLVLAWKLNAEQMCRFTREEFVQGLKQMKADSIKTIQARLPELVEEIRIDPEQFKDLYRFTFRFGLDVVTGQRILPSDMAICLWKLVFSLKEPPILQRWLTFLEAHPLVRGIPRDTWNMFLNFSEAVGEDLSSYDDTEAWPSLFDDFVEYENDQMNQNISKDKDCADKNIIKVDD